MRDEPEPRRLVVLVPDASPWVLGAWAEEIAEHNRDRFDFVVFPFEEIAERPEDFAAVLEDAAIVHCLAPSAYPELRRRAAALGADHLAWVASVHHVVEPGDVRACLEADRIAVMCDDVHSALRDLGVSEGRIHRLRKGVDTDFFAPGDTAFARKRLGIPETGTAIGFAGKAASDDRGRKGLDVFFAALACVADACDETLHLVISGPGWSELLARHTPPGVAVHYFPFVSRESMPDFFNAIDVYVSTARVEGGPLPVFEAMSCGKAVVSTRVGMVRDLVSDGSEALLVPTSDVAATAGAIDALRRDPDVATGLGRNARRKVVERLDCGATARAAGTLYASLRTERRSRRLGAEALSDLGALLGASDHARWRERFERLPAPAVRPRLRGAAEVAHVDLAALGVRVNSRVLDLGCGTGQLSLPLLARRQPVVSCDLDAARLAELRDSCAGRRLPAALLRADAARIPFADRSFDAVVCREMLEHVPHPGDVLVEIRRVLKPGGRLCVSVPSAHTERWFQRVDPRWLEMAGHVHVFSREAMCALLAANGFRVREVRGRNFFYSLFWFIHTFAGTTHDGTGRIQDHHRLADRVFRAWRLLGEGRLKQWIEAVGDRLFPKSFFYYCELPREPSP